MSTNNCAPGPMPNPDVSGIGVRLAFYGQAVLLAVLSCRSASAEEITQNLATLIMTNMAYAVTTLVLGYTSDTNSINLYDALIVLYLLTPSWMAVFFTMPQYNRHKKSLRVVKYLAVVQSYVVLACGFVVLTSIPSFGNDPACNDTLVFVIFARFPVTHGRIPFLVVLSIVTLLYTVMLYNDYSVLIRKKWNQLLDYFLVILKLKSPPKNSGDARGSTKGSASESGRSRDTPTGQRRRTHSAGAHGSEKKRPSDGRHRSRPSTGGDASVETTSPTEEAARPTQPLHIPSRLPGEQSHNLAGRESYTRTSGPPPSSAASQPQRTTGGDEDEADRAANAASGTQLGMVRFSLRPGYDSQDSDKAESVHTPKATTSSYPRPLEDFSASSTKYQANVDGRLIVNLILVIITSLFSILNTELLRYRNHPQASEGVWGFGQILPMFLTVLPAWYTLKAFREHGFGVKRKLGRKVRVRTSSQKPGNTRPPSPFSPRRRQDRQWSGGIFGFPFTQGPSTAGAFTSANGSSTAFPSGARIEEVGDQGSHHRNEDEDEEDGIPIAPDIV